MVRHAHHHDRFPEHTRLKHLILDAYIVAWGMKLLHWGGAGTRLAIVDAFAGRGQDSEGTAGSPLIAARRALEVVAAPSLRSRASIQVFAIEGDRNNFEALEAAVAPFNGQSPDLVVTRHGRLSDYMDEIVASCGGAPTFYFLDPYGIKGLDASTYSRALAGRHNEIFALFSDLGACRLYGLVTAEARDPARERETILARPSLFPEMDEAEAADAARAAQAANDALNASSPASRAHLNRALGNEEWVQSLAGASPGDRADRFIDLFRKAMIGAGAEYVLSLPMRNKDGLRVYSLVHASKSATAFATMKACISAGLNKSNLPGPIVERMRRDLSVDLDDLVVQLRRICAGQQIPWSSSNGLREYLLRTTSLFSFQCDDLRAALRRTGILKKAGRADVCVFP